MKSTNTLVLNPTENFVMNIKDDFELLEGLYISCLLYTSPSPRDCS